MLMNVWNVLFMHAIEQDTNLEEGVFIVYQKYFKIQSIYFQRIILKKL